MDKSHNKLEGTEIPLIIIWLIPLIYLPGLELINGFLSYDAPQYEYDLIFAYYFYALLAIALVGTIYLKGVKLSSVIGKYNTNELISGLKFTTFIFIFSCAAAYGLFYPLSFYAPDFVKYWFIDLPTLIIGTPNGYPIIPNVLSFVSLCILAPVIEEFVFRVVLLHSWQSRFGINKSILFSSILFGIVHPDPIGAIAFGVAMCVLYLRTQNILIPILCHAFTNLLCWLIELGYFLNHGPSYMYSLEGFLQEWYLGVISGVLVAIWGYVYINKNHKSRVWRLPRV